MYYNIIVFSHNQPREGMLALLDDECLRPGQVQHIKE